MSALFGYLSESPIPSPFEQVRSSRTPKPVDGCVGQIAPACAKKPPLSAFALNKQVFYLIVADFLNKKLIFIVTRVRSARALIGFIIDLTCNQALGKLQR